MTLALVLAASLLRQADPDEATRAKIAAMDAAAQGIRAGMIKAFVNIQGEWDAKRGEWAFRRGADWLRYDPERKALVPREAFVRATGQGRRAPGRGRQFAEAIAPDGKTKAVARDRNIVLVSSDGKETPITTDGSDKSRVKYGTASWVYGEELEQTEAMWFSPDGKRLAYYRFDESKVPDYFVPLGEGGTQNKVAAEAYPKPGMPNPEVELWVRELATGKTTKVDTRFGDAARGEYVYAIRWLDTDSLLYSRMERDQENMEVVRADARTGASKTLRTESNPGGWVEASPGSGYLQTGEGMRTVAGEALWISEASGFRNIVAFDLNGERPARAITKHPFDVQTILLVDAARKEIWYEARSAANPYLMQLHRVGFDGKGDVRLTDPSVGHSARIAPDGSSFADMAEAWDRPPVLTLRGRDGKEIVELGRGESVAGPTTLRRFSTLGGDGKTRITGWVKTPAGKGPWPTIFEVYGGPGAGTNRERHEMPSEWGAVGFATAGLDSRGSFGRGRAFTQAVAKRLGGPEIDDMAAFAKGLAEAGIADPKRIGITGTSYGGYASAMAILRYPDVFRAAAASSAVTDWRQYDTIYTERYMKEPKENEAGYAAGAAATYAKNLKGRLLLYYGTADDNVHPSNAYALIRALDAAGKDYDLRVGVDQGHTGVRGDIERRFFLRWLGP